MRHSRKTISFVILVKILNKCYPLLRFSWKKRRIETCRSLIISKVLIRSNTVFAYLLILQTTGDENTIREASEESNTSPLYNSEEEFQEIENVEYNLGTCVGPQLFQEHVNNNAPDELDRCLQKGLACATIIGNELGRPKQANWLLDRLL